MNSIISRLYFKRTLKAARKNKLLLFLGLVAVLVLIYLFAPIKTNFATSPQLFTMNQDGSSYLPASASGSTCSGTSCVFCDPRHLSCGSCTIGSDRPECGFVPPPSCVSCSTVFNYCDGSTCTEIVNRNGSCGGSICNIVQGCPDNSPYPNCSVPPPITSNPVPIGVHDISDCTASYGWTCDASNYSVPLAVHFYTDGGVLIGATTANIPAEPGVAAACGGFAAHRFQFTTPESLKTGTNRQIGAFAIDYPSGNNNPLLSGSPKTINCPAPLVNNASCLGVSAPGSVTVGQNFSASVAMQNTGTNPWNADATPHGLGSENPQNNLVWGLGRVGLPSQPINPGQSTTFNFTATAPNTAGTRSFNWRMVEDLVEWFGQTCQATIVVTNPPPSPTASISADTNPVVYNTATTIRWSSTNATSCTVSPPGWTGTSGAQSTGPLTTATTYTVNCSGAGGSASASVTVNIQPPGGFSLSLGGSVACNSVPLSWTASSGATAYRILKGSTRVDISPYQPYTALNFTDTTVSQNTSYLYQIEAYNSGGTNRSNALNVDTPFCPPTLNFSADRPSIFHGQSVILSWDTTYVNPNGCNASSVPNQSSWSGSKAVNGSQPVVPLPPPSVTYNLQCSGPGGTSPLRSVIINITALALPEFREIIPR